MASVLIAEACAHKIFAAVKTAVNSYFSDKKSGFACREPGDRPTAF
jgi:hypothetical protein